MRIRFHRAATSEAEDVIDRLMYPMGGPCLTRDEAWPLHITADRVPSVPETRSVPSTKERRS